MRVDNRGPRRGAPPGRHDPRRPRDRARPSGSTRPPLPQEWFAEQLVLVLSGRRPVHSLLGHARDTAYEQLSRLAPGAPLRPASGARGTPALRGVGICQPRPDAIEAFARIATGDRVRALAFRLERTREGRWLCSAIEMDTR